LRRLPIGSLQEFVMSRPYSIAPRSAALNGLFASLACAMALTLTAGPALAQPVGMERVEVHGRVVDAPLRYDVRANCDAIETQLQDELQTTWEHEQRVGQVQVQFVMDGSEVTAVKAQGISSAHERAVRHAVNALTCGQHASAGPQVYRFTVAFVDPATSSTQMAAVGRRARVVALLTR
jgi:hypothetical protein